VAKLELGPVGVALPPGDGPEFDAAMAEVEGLGYSAIWLSGGALTSLDQIGAVIGATQRIPVVPGIISVDRYDAPSVAAAYAASEAAHPGRFIVGLGGAHGARPIDTLNAYLDRLDSTEPIVPAPVRVLAALGPRMLRLARDRAAGALPVLVTPEYTAQARATLGDDSTLIIQQLVVLSTDADRARELARGPLGFLGTVPAYQANFRRMGFTDDDIATLSDRLIDALVARGTPDTIAAHVAAHHAAGADHVALSVVADNALPLAEWRELAAAVTA
jgi:probable F420-dependent oxidoreductase